MMHRCIVLSLCFLRIPVQGIVRSWSKIHDTYLSCMELWDTSWLGLNYLQIVQNGPLPQSNAQNRQKICFLQEGCSFLHIWSIKWKDFTIRRSSLFFIQRRSHLLFVSQGAQNILCFFARATHLLNWTQPQTSWHPGFCFGHGNIAQESIRDFLSSLAPSILKRAELKSWSCVPSTNLGRLLKRVWVASWEWLRERVCCSLLISLRSIKLVHYHIVCSLLWWFLIWPCLACYKMVLTNEADIFSGHVLDATDQRGVETEWNFGFRTKGKLEAGLEPEVLQLFLFSWDLSKVNKWNSKEFVGTN